MAFEVARVRVGAWELTIHDESPSISDDYSLELCIEGDDFDVSVTLPSIDSLMLLASGIEEADIVNVRAKERCYLHWGMADLFIFVDESRLTFLLLNTVGEQRRFRFSVPVTEKNTFLEAIRALKDEAEAEL
jgi:hypothetical protein